MRQTGGYETKTRPDYARGEEEERRTASEEATILRGKAARAARYKTPFLEGLRYSSPDREDTD